MDVLILDKKFEEKKGVVIGWYDALVQRGHKPYSSDTLSRHRERANRGLEDYEVIIAHPTVEDLRAIKSEIDKRPEFRVILNSG